MFAWTRARHIASASGSDRPQRWVAKARNFARVLGSESAQALNDSGSTSRASAAEHQRSFRVLPAPPKKAGTVRSPHGLSTTTSASEYASTRSCVCSSSRWASRANAGLLYARGCTRNSPNVRATHVHQRQSAAAWPLMK
eukprot:CAMPEP_0183333572 /NCGR_PEP_ID=MMETSP0164_2-20130417/2452_1 /TAXON_ID=221442 /ORGANISM="Coccolithus pelagicus ssp braarudi, Strain PLY182g" /LENGTH=139 /DNA_ID=CAMNT_0025502539 /DNA_START=714 /DNA_END=1130 /DNA_ORIENTATION=-